MTFFALIHGGAHGGWCWEELGPELEQRGHGWSAADLPFGDEDGASEWADAVLATIPASADDVVVVGHSLGGLATPVVAARRAVRRMVFLGAMVPVPGRTFLDVMADEPDAIRVDGVSDLLQGDGSDPFVGTEEEDADAAMPWSVARTAFYQDLPEEQARRAWRRLRSQGLHPFTEPCPIDRWPDVPSTYVLMRDDQAVNPAWSRRVATGRLGADLIELDGGHSPFLGRPAELAEVLHHLATG